MKRSIVIIILSILISSLMAIEVSGTQTGVWTPDNNPYQIVGDVSIPLGQSLEIQPGVVVEAMGNYRINAEGSIQAVGTETDSIYFLNAQEPPTNLWKGIRLDGPEQSVFTHIVVEYAEYGINSADSPMEVSYSRFSYNQRGLQLFGIGSANPANMNVHHNIIEYTLQNGILIPQNSNAWVHHNEVRYNGNVPQYYGAIQLANQSGDGQNNPIIEHNYIHDNYKQGITAWDIVGAGAINPTIRYNHIEGNLTGIYLLNSSGVVHDNLIINNFIPGDTNSGAGMMIGGATSAPYIAGNTLTGNYTAFFITSNAVPVLGDLADDHPFAYGQNIIQNNIDESQTLHSVVCSNYTASENIIKAQNNDWGVYTADEIAIGITDQMDNPSLPLVEFEPWFEESPSLCITGSFSWDPEDYTDLEPQELELLIIDTESRETLESHILSSNPFTIQSEVSTSFYALLVGVDPSREIYASPGALDDPISFDPSLGGDIDLGDIYINAWQQYNVEFKGESEIISGREIFPVYKSFLFFPYDTIDYFFDEGDYRYIYRHKYYDGDQWQTVNFGFDHVYEKINNLSHGDTWEQNYVENGMPIQYTVSVNIDDTGERTYFTINQSLNKLSQRYVGDDYERIYLWEENVPTRMLEADESEQNIRILYHNPIPNHPSELRVRTEISEEIGSDLSFWWIGYPEHLNDVDGYNIFRQKEGEAPEIYTFVPSAYNSWNFSGMTGNGTYYFWVTYVAGDFESDPSNTVSVTLATLNEDLIQQPTLNIYPNPVNFTRDGGLNVQTKDLKNPKLSVYNIRGQKVASLILDAENSTWNGRDRRGKALGSGIYLLRVEDDRHQIIQRRIVITK